MTNPPIKKKKQSDFKQTNVRLPPDIYAELEAMSDRDGSSINAELIARLRANEIAELRAEVSELRTMLREVLDIVRDKL